MIKLNRDYSKFVNLSPLLSFNASLYIILGARNIGKTWSAKSIALLNGIKHHHKTMFVRMFKEERNRMMADFLSPKLLKHLNIDQNKIKVVGTRVMYNFGSNGKDNWDWIICGVVLSQHRTLKSADDPRTRFLIFDEFLTDREHLVMYRGDWINHLQQLMVTIGRDHKLTTFLLGNKECASNKLFTSLGIKIPSYFQGIRRYCDGEVVVEQINDVPDKITEHYEKHLKKIFDKTGFSTYLVDGGFNDIPNDFIKPLPKNCIGICQASFDISQHKCTIYKYGKYYWVTSGINPSTLIITDKQSKYNFSIMYTNDNIKDFLKLLKEKREKSLIRFVDEISLESYDFAIKKCKI